ncbi:MAG: pyrroloquinoline quinone-dependent dehydrogenase [Acidobacteria bacterium]|nr:MAG: pyrroloquinoline quinone-dependent dehydrogenase [Acidobacteriota bacterium]
MRPKFTTLFLSVLISTGLWSQTIRTRNAAADWPMYNRDFAGTRYSPLAAIHTGNADKLKQIWSYRLRPEGTNIVALSPNEIFQEVTPIVVDGVMYLPSGNRVVALEPETGKEIWSYALSSGLASFRGVAYWPGDRSHPARILFTSSRKLMAVNTVTGELSTGFGTDGAIDLEIPYAGVPIIYKNIILMGTNFYGPGERHIAPQLETSAGQRGDVSAYDARSGKKLWEFHTIPRPGETGNDTWGNDSWKNRTGNNVWAFSLTLDQDRGNLYLPVSGPGANFYGGDRPGINLFGNTTVAVDAETGKLKWYFQSVHHELWDYNLPPAPGLIDIIKDGKKIPALAQVGKTGYMYILDRVTGKPVFGVEERSVARGDVPGEWYSPTQPIPVKPPAIARVSMTADDLVNANDTTPEHAGACREVWEKNNFYNAGPFTPFRYKDAGSPPSAVFPGLTGGPNWGGTAVDPNLQYIFVASKDSPTTGWVQKNPKYTPGNEATEFPYVRIGAPNVGAPLKDSSGGTLANLPCFKPPWATLIAVDAKTGDFAWQVPLGINEALPDGKRNTGSPGAGGPIVTAGGLVFIGATGDHRFRAFDSKNGKELWVTKLDYNVTAVPMTYQGKDGRQYVAVVAASGRSAGANNTESLVVFGLP